MFIHHGLGAVNINCSKQMKMSSTYQAVHQPAKIRCTPLIAFLINGDFGSSIYKSVHKISRSICYWSGSQAVGPPINQPICQSISRFTIGLIHQSINRSINQSVKQSINQLSNQSIDQSVKQSINRSIS